MGLLSWLGDLFIPHPIFAIIPGVILLLTSIILKNRFVGLIAAIWAVYGLYEWLMKERIICSGECNIRVDLLGIYPSLLVVSAAGIVVSVRQAFSCLLSRRKKSAQELKSIDR